MEGPSIHNDRELFLKIAAGNEAAFTELFHLYTPQLLPFVLKLTRHEQQAKEIIQETFLNLWVNRSKLAGIQQPASWIFRIASNMSISWLRSQSSRRKLLGRLNTGERDTDIVTETVEVKELTGIIHRAVDALPGRRKQIYQLSREQGLSHQQIAEELGLSVNTVKNQIGISLKFIQEFISKETGLSLITLLILFGK